MEVKVLELLSHLDPLASLTTPLAIFRREDKVGAPGPGGRAVCASGRQGTLLLRQLQARPPADRRPACPHDSPCTAT